MRLFYKNLRRTQSGIETSLRSAENVYPADANSERHVSDRLHALGNNVRVGFCAKAAPNARIEI